MNPEQKRWLDEPRNVNRIVYALYVVCALLVMVDLLVSSHIYDKHGDFDFELWFGFFGFFGFVACVGLVLAAKLLRIVLRREEDYYDRSA